jgi:DNA-binding NtrC family response regulator
MKKFNVLVIDDEPNILLSIEACLNPKHYKVDSFTRVKEAFIAMQQGVYDCALIDIRLDNDNGIELFKRMKAADIVIPTIFMSGNASLDEAAESQKLGAYDFIEKPFSSDKLKITLDNCLNYYQLRNKLSRLEQSKFQSTLVGDHPLMQELKTEIAKVAKTDAVVFVHGESGTGKELIATAIHNLSSRADNEMITVNCSAIPNNLLESALFGHTKGAFTGADKAKKGYFEQAHQSTLFLDEIGDMPLSAQASLLRVLENKEIQKVGSESVIKVDVRVIAASHKNLKSEVELGNFREDLFYRINVIPITSPSLKQRLSDLELLVHYLIGNLCNRHGLPLKQIEPTCLHIFEKYAWPGNVRELTNTLERMIIMGGETLLVEDIPKDITHTKQAIGGQLSLKEFRAVTEREFIIQRLKLCKGNISKVAKSLDIDRTNLHKKIKQYEINKEQSFN